jgi:hypothetical protein
MIYKDATNHKGLYMLGIVIGAQEETEVGHEVLCPRAQAMRGYTSEAQGILEPNLANSSLSPRRTKHLPKPFQKVKL